MPTMVGQALPRVSQLVVDADLTIPTAYRIIAENIQPPAGAHLDLNTANGVNSLRIYETLPMVKCFGPLYTDVIQEGTLGARTTFGTGIKTNTIDDNGAAAISILEDVELAATKYLKAPLGHIDALYDQTGAAAASFPAGLNTDDINEYTGAHGIDLNDPVTLDALVTKLTQMYLTAAASDTLRKSSDAEAIIANPGGTWTLVKGSFTVPSNYVGSGNGLRIKWAGKTQYGGGLPRQAVFVNGVKVGVDKAITNSYANLTDDISGISAGDVITIYSYDLGGTTGQHYAKEFRVCCNDTIAHVMGSLTW